MMLTMTVAESLKQRALEIGFDLAGVAPITAWHDLVFARQWVKRGFAGEMGYLENPKRDDPRLVLPSAESVVCVGLVYNANLPYSTQMDSTKLSEPAGERNSGAEEGATKAWISRYGWGKDYHQIMRGKLEQLRAALESLAPNIETRVYVDTGPIVERAFAKLSGIGWVGKNTCLINQQAGSWFFLGVLLTNLVLQPDLPAPDRCGSCTRCLDACPTGALVEPYVMDASRCIAYFTIELRGSIPEEFRPAIGVNVFGCDICQDVCPWNARRRAATTELPEFQPLKFESAEQTKRAEEETANPPGVQDREATRAIQDFSPVSGFSQPPEVLTSRQAQKAPVGEACSLFSPALDALAALSEDDFRRLFSASPIKRAKYRGWLRNLCVAMGNSRNQRFLPWLEQARHRADPLIQEHAEWAIERLTRSKS